ncbi:MAG: hypothetical protein DCC49_11720 [Acidobacteria bacterium]|nr:MAG: hypothetical protein DCC49_11720 [Acidobacteriota bacterium]
MGKLFVASTKILFRDRQSLFWAMVFPLLFTVIFSLFARSGGGGGTVVLVVDEPSPIADAITSAFEQSDAIKLERSSDFETASREVQDGKKAMAIHVTSPDKPIIVVFDQNNSQVTPLLLGALRQVVDAANLAAAGVQKPAYVLEQQGLAARDVSAYDFYLPGFVALGVMNFAIVGVAGSITQYREQKILRRIRAAPVKPVNFLGAQVLARVMLSILQIAVIIGVGLMMGAHIYGSIPLMFVIGAVGNLIFLNIGFVIAGRAKTVDSAQGAANAIAVPMMFLAGVFFPIALLPPVLQAILKFLPLTPLVSAMRKIALEAAGIGQLGGEIALLAAWIVVSFAAAVALFRFDRS